MTFRVEVVCVGDDGEEHRRDAAAMKRHHLTMDTLGLNLRESQALLAGVQDFVVTQQAAEEAAAKVPAASAAVSATPSRTVERRK